MYMDSFFANGLCKCIGTPVDTIPNESLNMILYDKSKN